MELQELKEAISNLIVSRTAVEDGNRAKIATYVKGEFSQAIDLISDTFIDESVTGALKLTLEEGQFDAETILTKGRPHLDTLLPSYAPAELLLPINSMAMYVAVEFVNTICGLMNWEPFVSPVSYNTAKAAAKLIIIL